MTSSMQMRKREREREKDTNMSEINMYFSAKKIPLQNDWIRAKNIHQKHGSHLHESLKPTHTYCEAKLTRTPRRGGEREGKKAREMQLKELCDLIKPPNSWSEI